MLGLVALALKYALLVGVLAYVIAVLRAMILTMPCADGGARKPSSARTSTPATRSRARQRPAPPRSEGPGVPTETRAEPAPRPAPALAPEPEPEVTPEPRPVASSEPSPWPAEADQPSPWPAEVEEGPAGPVLIVQDPGDSHLVIWAPVHLGQGIHVGRAPENDLVLDSPSISRQHAYIGPRGDAWLLVDKGSANGSFVNGRRISGPQELRDGDAVTLGALRFVFSLRGGDPAG